MMYFRDTLIRPHNHELDSGFKVTGSPREAKFKSLDPGRFRGSPNPLGKEASK